MEAYFRAIKSITVENGFVSVQGTTEVGNDENDVDETGPSTMLFPPGFVAAPVASNDKGKSLGLFIDGAGGANAVCIGVMPDERVANFAGTMRPGDVAIYSLDPDRTTMVRVNGQKRQVTLITREKDGTQAFFTMDGLEKVVQLNAFGGLFEFADGNWTIRNKSGAGISIEGKAVIIDGQFKFSRTATRTLLAGPTGVSGTPVLGAFGGIALCILWGWVIATLRSLGA